MSIRINGLQLSVKRVIPPGHDRAERLQPRRGLDKSRNPEAARRRVANLLLIGRKLTEKSARPWELVARTAEGVCGRIDQHKGVIVRRFLLMQAARNGWDYTQAACRWGCSCLDVVESISANKDIGIAQDNTIFVIPKETEQ